MIKNPLKKEFLDPENNPDYHQNLINWCFSHFQPLLKTIEPTRAWENIASLVEVIMLLSQSGIHLEYKISINIRCTVRDFIQMSSGTARNTIKMISSMY